MAASASAADSTSTSTSTCLWVVSEKTPTSFSWHRCMLCNRRRPVSKDQGRGGDIGLVQLGLLLIPNPPTGTEQISGEGIPIYTGLEIRKLLWRLDKETASSEPGNLWK